MGFGAKPRSSLKPPQPSSRARKPQSCGACRAPPSRQTAARDASWRGCPTSRGPTASTRAHKRTAAASRVRSGRAARRVLREPASRRWHRHGKPDTAICDRWTDAGGPDVAAPALNRSRSSSVKSVNPSDDAGVQLAVLADQVFDFRFRFIVQRIVGGAHVGKLGIAAGRWDQPRGQQRKFRRHRLE